MCLLENGGGSIFVDWLRSELAVLGTDPGTGKLVLDLNGFNNEKFSSLLLLHSLLHIIDKVRPVSGAVH